MNNKEYCINMHIQQIYELTVCLTGSREGSTSDSVQSPKEKDKPKKTEDKDEKGYGAEKNVPYIDE